MNSLTCHPPHWEERARRYRGHRIEDVPFSMISHMIVEEDTGYSGDKVLSRCDVTPHYALSRSIFTGPPNAATMSRFGMRPVPGSSEHTAKPISGCATRWNIAL